MAVLSMIIMSFGVVLMTTSSVQADDDNGVTCKKSGYPDNVSSFSSEAGTVSFDGETVTFTVNDGFALDICVKGGSEDSIHFFTATEDGTYTHPQNVSHIGVRVIEVPEEELCPEGTDREGEPIGEGGLESCDEEEPPAVCPEDSEVNAGEEIPEGETEESFCNEDEVELCPEGTDRAGEPVGDEPCNEGDEVVLCPPGSDRAGEARNGEACNEDDILGREATRPRAQPEAEVLGTEAVAVPTAVKAGLVGQSDTGSSVGVLVGQGLLGAGLLLFVTAGWTRLGRRNAAG